MRELCTNNRFYFTSHQHITRDFLYHDGVHLTDSDTKIIADNIVAYINNFILWQNLPNNAENIRDSPEQGIDHLDMKNNSYSKETFSSVSERIKLRKKYTNNPIISYLNLNLLRNKIASPG